jgi:hypothetical protein
MDDRHPSGYKTIRDHQFGIDRGQLEPDERDDPSPRAASPQVEPRCICCDCVLDLKRHMPWCDYHVGNAARRGVRSRW